MKHARPDYDRIQDHMGKIPDDEPVFLIRGQDTAAIRTLQYYAHVAESHGADAGLINAVRRQVDAIRRWQEENGSKVADLPAAVEVRKGNVDE